MTTKTAETKTETAAAAESNGTENHKIVLKGRLGTVGFKKKRTFFTATLPFREYKDIVTRREYSAASGQGEQRQIVTTHARMLSNEMKEDNYTPTAVSVHLPKSLQEKVRVNQQQMATLEFTIGEDELIPITDGGHRTTAWTDIFDQYERLLADEDTDAAELEAILDQDIPIMVHVQGSEPKRDFLHLNGGKPVNKTLMLSQSIRTGEISDDPKVTKLYKFGHDLIKELGDKRNKDSFLCNMVSMDGNGKFPLNMNGLMAKTSSDLATSVLGGGKIMLYYVDKDKRDKGLLARCIMEAYNAIDKQAPAIMAESMLLQPPPSGTKAGATMLVGIGNLLCWRVCNAGRDEIQESDLIALVKAAKKTLHLEAKGNAAAEMKRSLIGSFAEAFFKDVETEKTDNIPDGLISLLNRSAFGLKKVAATPPAGGETDAA